MNETTSAGCNPVERELDALRKENEQLRLERDDAIKMLAEWCAAVEENGTGWTTGMNTMKMQGIGLVFCESYLMQQSKKNCKTVTGISI